MTTVQIDRFHSRARLPYAAQGLARIRLSGATDRLLDTLPDLLEASGLPPHVHVCIRSLTVTVPLSADAFLDEDVLARTWAAAIAAAIGNAYADPSGPATARPAGAEEAAAIVAYRSAAAALADLVAGVARGDLRRRWAWAQLGLCRPDGACHPAALVVEACMARPDLVVAALGWAAALGHLDRLDLTWPDWQRLATALAPFTAGPRSAADASTDSAAVPAAPRVEAALAGSALLAVLTRTGRRLGPPPAALHPALARLVLAADTPELRRTPSVVAAAVTLLVPPSPAAVPERPPSAPANPRGTAGSAHHDPGAGLEAADPSRRTPQDPGADSAAPRERPNAVVPGLPAATEPGSAIPAAVEPGAAEARTVYGGLPFLLNLHAVRTVDPPVRSLRWTLAALGRVLSGADPDDPAVLVLAGLSPLAPVPPALLDPPAEADQAELASLTEQVEIELAHRLPGLERPPQDLLDHVIRRPARIVADPGWIEVILPLDCVDTDLRRAGLDLDPGALMSLGCVVRFGYE